MSEVLDVQERSDEADLDARTCTECGGDVRPDGDERHCTECGLVVETDAIDRGPEWLSHGRGSNLRRCNGGPTSPSQHDGGLGSEIPTDKTGGRLQRQKQYHKRTNSKVERNQVYANTEIDRLTSALEMPKAARDRACKLFGDAQEAGVIRGRSLDGGAAAAVQAAAREMNLSTVLDDIEEVARADASEIWTTYQEMADELDCYQLPPTPSELVARIASEVDAGPAVERRARELAETLEETGRHSGKMPTGIAAGAVYLGVCESDEVHRTQVEIAEAAGVSAMTVRNGMYLLQEVCGDGGENTDD